MSRRLPKTEDGALPAGLVQWLSNNPGPYELLLRSGRQYNGVVDLRSERARDVIDELPMHIEPLIERLSNDPPPRWPEVTLAVGADAKRFQWKTTITSEKQLVESEHLEPPPEKMPEAPDVQLPEIVEEPVVGCVVCPRCLRPTSMADPNSRLLRDALRDVLSVQTQIVLAQAGPALPAPEDFPNQAEAGAVSMFEQVAMQALARLGNNEGGARGESPALDLRDNVLAILGIARVEEIGELVPVVNTLRDAETEDDAKRAAETLETQLPQLLRLLRPNELSKLMPLFAST